MNRSLALIDPDQRYLQALELKFLEKYQDIDIHMITDLPYVKEHFSQHRSYEMVLICESWFEPDLLRHDLGDVILLSETSTNIERNAQGIVCLPKYSSVKEIISYVSTQLESHVVGFENHRQTTCICLYSPLGQMGKTTLAVGLSSALARQQKKVLYVSLDELQCPNPYFDPPSYIPEQIEKNFVSGYEFLYQSIKEVIRNQGFDYLPPFYRALSASKQTAADQIAILEAVRSANEYDYLILDMSSSFGSELTRLMSVVDKVLILTGQSQSQALRLEAFLKNVDTSDTKKFLFACNRYRPSMTNALLDSPATKGLRISAYIPEWDESDEPSLEDLGKHHKIVELSYQF